MSADKNPVKYAEDILGVHVPWADAQTRLERHAEISDELDQIRSNIRSLKEVIEQREMEITADAPSRNDWPSSQTAQKAMLKVLFAVDDWHRESTASLDHGHQIVENLEREKKHHELALHVLTARMIELGGLLQFYAVAKQQAITIGMEKRV